MKYCSQKKLILIMLFVLNACVGVDIEKQMDTVIFGVKLHLTDLVIKTGNEGLRLQTKSKGCDFGMGSIDVDFEDFIMRSSIWTSLLC